MKAKIAEMRPVPVESCYRKWRNLRTGSYSLKNSDDEGEEGSFRHALDCGSVASDQQQKAIAIAPIESISGELMA